GQYRAAMIEARNALQQNPQDRSAILKLASILNELGSGKSAIKLLEPLAGDCNRNEALALARGYFLQHKNQSALDTLDTHSKRLHHATDKDALLLKAQAQLRLSLLDDAELTLTKTEGERTVETTLARIHLLQLRGDAETANVKL